MRGHLPLIVACRKWRRMLGYFDFENLTV